MKNYFNYSNITRESVFTDLVCVSKLGQITPEQEMAIAESIGTVKKPVTEREHNQQKAFKGPLDGISNVTQGALFGTKETLDWHANKPSNENRASIVWIYAVKGSKGSITSWIDNRAAYNDLDEDMQNRCKEIQFTCGFKSGNYTVDEFFKDHHNQDLKWDLVQTNEAGQTGLYFPFNQILGGIPDDLFEYLKHHVLKDKYRYDHHWEDGDLVVSEQWLTIHKRHEFEHMDKRLMHRIAIS